MGSKPSDVSSLKLRARRGDSLVSAPDAHQGRHYISTGPSTPIPARRYAEGSGEWGRLRCSDAPVGIRPCGPLLSFMTPTRGIRPCQPLRKVSGRKTSQISVAILPGYHRTDAFSLHAKLSGMICFEQLKYEFFAEESYNAH